MQLRKRLPSLTALVALEATIRHRSFTTAAKELGVTQAAVSRQIALLEEDFGKSLFHRGHRSIEPTPACLLLGAALADSFSTIADSVDAMRATATDVVTIGATIAFSSFWLLPKIAELRQLDPKIQIRVISQDSKIDLTNGIVDIAIRYGSPPFNDGTVLASCDDRIFPVCSPQYAASHLARDFPDGDYELIESDVPDKSWYGWDDWFARLGWKPGKLRSMLRFSHYTEAITAARAGQGVALGWDTLIKTFLADGSLVKLGDFRLQAEGRHNILVPLNTKRSRIADFTAGWLMQALQQ
ncbi:LysR substrate-binding domain-containing protein [Rhizobium sp. 2YAF20]|uniref:LysR substrate-binding domain-containing protein n=1 Tax=Rhizobium sp. 2YAF20 TaxID=3233027 RepID=UPI003F9D5F79